MSAVSVLSTMGSQWRAVRRRVIFYTITTDVLWRKEWGCKNGSRLRELLVRNKPEQIQKNTQLETEPRGKVDRTGWSGCGGWGESRSRMILSFSLTSWVRRNIIYEVERGCRAKPGHRLTTHTRYYSCAIRYNVFSKYYFCSSRRGSLSLFKNIS